jgi:uncharacterized protein (TIGR03437 family)
MISRCAAETSHTGATLTTTSVVPGAVVPAPRQYGNFWVEQADAYGGWIGNAIDLMKYINALEGRRGPAILNAASLAAIIACPAPPVTPTGPFVGLTWRITPITGGQHWWHSGGATGTRNILARRQNNRDWVVLMNSRPEDEDTIITEIFDAFAVAEPNVTSWPTNDLFADFAGPTLSTGAQSLAFTHSYGSAAPEAQTLQVTAAPSAVNFTIAQPAARWLRVDRLSGVTPAAIRVSVDPAGLEPGDYQGLIAVAAPLSANGARWIQVSLRVTPTPGFTLMRNSASLPAVQSAAPESRLIIEGQDLATTSAKSDGIPEPGPVKGVTIRIIDSASVELPAAIVELSPARIDIVLPPGLQPGDASIAVTTSKGRLLRDRLQIESVTPALFTANGDGTGAPLAVLLRVAEDGTTTSEPDYDCSAGAGACTTIPIDLGLETDTVGLQLAATGVRSQTDPAAFAARIGDENADVIAIQPSSTAAGVDLVTVRLPRTLAGRGDLDLTLAVAGKTSNAVKINVK